MSGHSLTSTPTKTAVYVCGVPCWCPFNSLQVTDWMKGGSGNLLPRLGPEGGGVGLLMSFLHGPGAWYDHPGLHPLPRL